MPSRRSCAITGCTNSWYTLEKWMQNICETHGCNHGLDPCTCEPPFKLVPFPTERKNPEGRKKWISLVNRKNWQPNVESRICSQHFADGKPTPLNPYPTLHLGYALSKITVRQPPRDRHAGSGSPPLKKIREFTEHTSKISQDTSDIVNVIDVEHGYAALNESPMVNMLKEKITKLENHLKYYKIMYKRSVESNKKNMLNTVLKNDANCKFYTGIPKVQTLNDLYDPIEEVAKNIIHWKGPKRNCNPIRNKVKFIAANQKRKLSLKEEFTLTLMKLKLGLLFKDLADRFNISATHASNVFTTWIKILSKTLGTLVFNPSKEEVKENLPPTFRDSKYNNVRHIIDCTEVFVEKSNNLEVAATTYSDYKNHNTAKFLVSCTPAGMINFVSECWGGRASDKFITNNSGFLDIVEPYDAVMADRGFPIREELALRRAELFVPPGRRGVSQFSKSDVKATKDIANRRIYIEQAIRRMKYFRILKYELPLTLIHHLDDMVKTIAGICNMYPPLPKYN